MGRPPLSLTRVAGHWRGVEGNPSRPKNARFVSAGCAISLRIADSHGIPRDRSYTAKGRAVRFCGHANAHARSFMASASQLRLSIGSTQPALEEATPILRAPSPRHCPDTSLNERLSAAATRPCSPFHLPPSWLDQSNQCSSGSSDECTSDECSDASTATSDVVQERKAGDCCSYCGLAITGSVYMGFDRRFCSSPCRCRGLSDEIRLQHWRGAADFLDHVHKHAPSCSSSPAPVGPEYVCRAVA
jgi:hypothetical protein